MFQRFRRTRLNKHLRALVRETQVSVDDFIYPLFVRSGEGIKTEVASMPGVYQMSIDVAVKECAELKELGIYSIILFGIPDTKDSVGSDALCEHGIIASAVKEIKKVHPDMFVVTDLCFCEYTDHGHCGIIDEERETVVNDATLELSGKQAVVHAKAGVDMIAPSGMMDGIIETLRDALDEAGYEDLPIMSYSTKFASGYYGPFRDVAESTPSFGDRSSYQMDPANRREAIAESIEDEAQGADILMVKPVLAYLDIVREIKDNTTKPLAVYNVSGEYAMLKHAGAAGLIDYDRVMMETMVAFKRAGADIIISYHAKEVAKLLKK
ncbi:porphobilinogen synthase [Sulfurimonas marina]|uniref:Delta-aminolevulinic acid dehydratase n=1 Tax=Sulfurimonas marina TaxID=2590551 RepID=A0A7M1AV87_9BACT|nr:porphobilinogen synthase [Sulfurimonas marina]QOP40498.1 porphobilinogen synthase [Sulfurimonas marina]